MRYWIFILSLALVYFSLNSFVCSPLDGDLVELLRGRKAILQTTEDISPFIAKAGEKRLVLLGESTHGTSEYYYWRAEISKRLISEKGFSFIAVEGDWASIYRLNLYVRGMPGSGNSAKEVMRSFNRWPFWMWANEETAVLIEWLRDYNKDLPDNKKVGFYGMDVYGQWEAMDELLDYVKKEIPGQYDEVKSRLDCFAAFGKNEWQYARAVNIGRESCENQLQEVIDILRESGDELRVSDPKRYFNAKQNAIVLKNAEYYYRLAVRGGANSWNSRVLHMNKTVNRLLDYYGEDSKGIVWAHNTHIGDSYATSMQQYGMFNIGHLTRKEHGRHKVFLAGFGTFSGTVLAGREWGSRQEIMRIPNGKKGSVEFVFNQVTNKPFYVLFTENDRQNPLLRQPLPHRAIGVVYDPRNEGGNYVQTILPDRYDTFFFFKETKALKPLR
jgi:erythromycin esterase